MKQHARSAFSLQKLLICVVILVVSSVFAAARNEKVIYAFGTKTGDGRGPNGGLVADSLGNFYGAAALGGASNAGTIYELSPPVPPGVSWTLTVIYAFSGGEDGIEPGGTLIFDNMGNIYGVVGSAGSNCQFGCGMVFELSPPAVRGGGWTESTIYTFRGGSDGAAPNWGLVIDSWGNLYGTTIYGGNNGSPCTGPPLTGCGTVFELSPPAAPGGSWTETVLYRFTGGPDGGFPEAPLVVDNAGNLYGTTHSGGDVKCDFEPCGAVFELTPSGGAWAETVIHNFGSVPKDGLSPSSAGLYLDESGALVGTTPEGGEHGDGAVFGMRPPSKPGGDWIYEVLHSFRPADGDGLVPQAGVTSANGVLYGTTEQGGANNLGTVFRLTLTESGVWRESGHYSFKGDSDGRQPSAAVLIHDGALFGTTAAGGSGDSGTVFKISK
jgi:uncharacterized repeat protein (TIGR03803 family)